MDKKKENRDFNSENSVIRFGEMFTTQKRIVLYWKHTAMSVHIFVF